MGNVVVVIGTAFMLIGVVGIFRFENFYLRLLVSSKVDTVGALTLIIGLALRHGVSYFSAKLILLIAIMLILNPLVAHMTAGAAYRAKYKIEYKAEEEEQPAGAEETI